MKSKLFCPMLSAFVAMNWLAWVSAAETLRCSVAKLASPKLSSNDITQLGNVSKALWK